MNSSNSSVTDTFGIYFHIYKMVVNWMQMRNLLANTKPHLFKQEKQTPHRLSATYIFDIVTEDDAMNRRMEWAKHTSYTEIWNAMQFDVAFGIKILHSFKLVFFSMYKGDPFRGTLHWLCLELQSSVWWMTLEKFKVARKMPCIFNKK